MAKRSHDQFMSNDNSRPVSLPKRRKLSYPLNFHNQCGPLLCSRDCLLYYCRRFYYYTEYWPGGRCFYLKRSEIEEPVNEDKMLITKRTRIEDEWFEAYRDARDGLSGAGVYFGTDEKQKENLWKSQIMKHGDEKYKEKLYYRKVKRS